MNSRLAMAAFTAVFCAIALPAQTPTLNTRPAQTPATAPATTAPQITIPTIVRDKKGALVTNLKKEDFSLQVDGNPQPIQSFDQATGPLTVGVLVDVSPGMQKQTDPEKAATQAFLDSMSAGDKAFVVQFAKQVELLQDATDAKPRLQRALNELGTSSASFHNTDDTSTGPKTDSEGRLIRHGGTALYDALFLSGDEVMSKQAAKRRVLILLTDGIDRGSKESLNDAIEAAQSANTIVYALYVKGEEQRQQNWNRADDRTGGGYPGGGYPGGYPGGGYPGGGYPGGGYPGGYPQGGGRRGQNPRPTGGDHKPNVDGKHVLDRICGETGGRVIEIGKRQSLEDAYKEIAEELHSQYRLGFTPTGDAAKDRYHQISLALIGDDAKKKLDIQCRDGYYMGQ